MHSADYNIAPHESNADIEVRLENFTELNHAFLVYESTNRFALLTQRGNTQAVEFRR